jgi:hypothetical protein
VQAAPTEAETAFMLEVARNSGDLVRGVVGWTDFIDRDASARICATRWQSAAEEPAADVAGYSIPIGSSVPKCSRRLQLLSPLDCDLMR